MKTLSGYKLQGTGNDFLLFDLTDKKQGITVPEYQRAALTQKWCHRNLGIGADGVVFITQIKNNSEITWDFYNSDGSPANMCGNAARCVGRWAFDTKNFSSPVSLQTKVGLIQLVKQATVIDVHMPKVQMKHKGYTFEHQGREHTCDIVDSGVPHAVFQRQHIHEHVEMQLFSVQIRGQGKLNPPDANITFVAPHNYDQADTVSFERGVNDFTLSCGTGALAAAYVLFEKQPHILQWKMKVPGGDLKIDFSGSTPVLSGPAEFIATIEIPIV